MGHLSPLAEDTSHRELLLAYAHVLEWVQPCQLCRVTGKMQKTEEKHFWVHSLAQKPSNGGARQARVKWRSI